MTIEQLEQGKKLAEEMKRLEEFHKAFHDPCMKGLLAYRAGIKEPATLSLESGSELYNLIDDYLGRKLSETKKKFEEM